MAQDQYFITIDMDQYIKEKYTEYSAIKKNIIKQLTQLEEAIQELTLLQQSYKETVKGNYSINLSKVLNKTQTVVNDETKVFKFLSKRNKIDKIFMERLELIKKPKRKNPVKTNRKPPLIKAAQLIGSIRDIKEKGLTDGESTMIKNLVKQLENEL